MSNNLTPEQRAAIVAELRQLSWFTDQQRKENERNGFDVLASACADGVETFTAAADAIEGEAGKDAEIAALAAQLVLMREALEMWRDYGTAEDGDDVAMMLAYAECVENNTAALALPLPEAARQVAEWLEKSAKYDTLMLEFDAHPSVELSGARETIEYLERQLTEAREKAKDASDAK